MNITNIGVCEYYRMSDAHEVLTPENVIDFVRRPERWDYIRHHPEFAPRPTPSQEANRLAHDFILSSVSEIEAKYVVADGPVNPKTGLPYGAETKAYKEWAAGIGKPAIQTRQAEMFYDMREKVLAAVEGSPTRAAVVSSDVPVKCMCLVDLLYLDTGIDIRPTSDIYGLVDVARKSGYVYKLALIHMACGGLNTRMLAVEKSIPSIAGMFMFSDDDIRKAEDEISHAADMVKSAGAGKKWSSPLSGRVITL